ncbi:hypothetical protein SAMN05443551_0853 [Marivita hallyeonensis]|uniref:DUF1993 domain-containing protein n=2 Tax=Marivita hallyeonensis TaxID=996342 RepID=A0A1M5NBW6_9RHOB|nr:hypothetical protein SAMN05443551_0853 [Marivita hallyeonensis]
MTDALAEAVPQSVRTYLDRVQHILDQVALREDGDDLLAIKLAPDMFDTGFNFAIAIQFAARALCPPARMDVPEIPDTFTCATLRVFQRVVADLIAPIRASDLRHEVTHVAGEAKLTQDPASYVMLFALPNMIFHLSLAYAGLRHGGMQIGKADFDGLHVY